METKSVPIDLFPTSEGSLTSSWAMKTIQYRNVFNAKEHFTFFTQTHIDEWKKEARDICSELKLYGTTKAEERIVYLCNNVYNGQLSNQKFQNMYQVIAMMSDKNLFRHNYETFLDLLHMFQYGIFRCQFNAWALDASNEWMSQKKIQYKVQKDDDARKSRGKGFVYKLLVSRASNTVCVRFQKLTERLYKEYIIVRDRKSKKIADAGTIVHHTFNKNYHGYIVKFEDQIHNDDNNLLSDENRNKICRYVTNALQRGIDIQKVFQVLENMYLHTTGGKSKHII